MAQRKKSKNYNFHFWFLEKQTTILCGTVYHHSPSKRANETVVITYWFQASALADQDWHCKGCCNRASNEDSQFSPENKMKVITIQSKVKIFINIDDGHLYYLENFKRTEISTITTLFIKKVSSASKLILENIDMKTNKKRCL